MKKILTVIILFLLVLFNSTTIFAAETNSFVEGNAEILSLDNSILREMSSNGSSKKIANSIGNNVIFEYKPYAEILLDNNDEKEVAKMYYYKNEIFYEDTLSTYSVDKDIIESEILEFYHDRFSFFQQIDSNIMNSVNTNSV